LQLPQILPGRRELLDAEEPVARLQAPGLRIAPRLDRHDEELVADHLHLPTVVEGLGAHRGNEIGVGIVEVPAATAR
jgi:hypothetical protein